MTLTIPYAASVHVCALMPMAKNAIPARVDMKAMMCCVDDDINKKSGRASQGDRFRNALAKREGEGK